eukprot:TRINITY_DN1466_c0_g1_i1.p1 TRINITY_DN1466_c0_g1~~TRINITY_DN1466_c0_g1_i1.p1  ORF type:complete len:178 (+),score=41.86 TRINITY_DN1466_c0_g1_i1:73-606(+)
MRFEPKKWLQAAKTLVLYTTVKQVVIKSIKLRLFKYFIQALVAAYVVFVIIYEKHYTHELDGFGFTQVVLKGNAYQLNANSTFRSIWDQTDIVIPGKERDAIFVVSNVQQTLHQQRGICDGVDNSGSITDWSGNLLVKCLHTKFVAGDSAILQKNLHCVRGVRCPEPQETVCHRLFH